MSSLIDQLTGYGQGRRMPNDSFFVAGDEICKATERLGVFDIDDEELCHKGVVAYPCNVPGCQAVYESLLLYEMHYNSIHRYSCSTCKKSLPSGHLLNLHVAEKHDSFFQAQAERKPMYLCFVEECVEIFSTPKDRRDHCITVHKYPHDFRFDDARKHKESDKKSKKGIKFRQETDVNMETSSDSNISKKPMKNIVLGKGKRGGKMWHSQTHSTPSTSEDVEFGNVQELKESLPDEEMS